MPSDRVHDDYVHGRVDEVYLDAITFILSLASARPAHSRDEYGLTAEVMVERAREFCDKHNLKLT
jgi:hypothetical protein